MRSRCAAQLRAAGLRVELDLRNEKINYKVREHSLAKVPVMLVVGKREAEEGKVSIRRLGSQDQTVMPLTEAIATLTAEATPPDVEARDARGRQSRLRRRAEALMPAAISTERIDAGEQVSSSPLADRPGLRACRCALPTSRQTSPRRRGVAAARVGS